MEIKFIRVENSSQIQRIVRLAGEIWKEYYTALIGMAQVEYMLEKFQSEEYIKKQISEGYEYYIFCHNDDVGYAGLSCDGNRVFLSKLYVKREYRGKGFGRMFINYVKDRFSACESIYLTVNKGNSSSIDTYKKLGFVVTDSVVNDIGGGFYMNDYIMTASV